VCVYRNWRNNTFAEYVAETQEAAVEYVRKYPDGEKLKFNPMVKSPAPTPKAEKILPFPVPEMNLETPNVRYVETAVRE
jgi:hypothetical protein